MFDEAFCWENGRIIGPEIADTDMADENNSGN